MYGRGRRTLNPLRSLYDSDVWYGLRIEMRYDALHGEYEYEYEQMSAIDGLERCDACGLRTCPVGSSPPGNATLLVVRRNM